MRFTVKKFGFNDYGVLDNKYGVRTAFFMNGSSVKEINHYCEKLNKKKEVSIIESKNYILWFI